MNHDPDRSIDSFARWLAMAVLTLCLAGCGGGIPIHPGAPTIATQPVGVTVSPGATVSLSVVANGTGFLAYQWFQSGVAIPGATASSLTLLSVPISATGNYTVVVTNTLGSITSQAASVTVTVVNVAPTITVQPVSVSVIVGGNANLTVVANGSGTLAYQWFQNGTAVAGATSSLLALSGVTTASAGSYTVSVTNASGSVISQPVALTVTDPSASNVAPTIITQPASVTVPTGASPTFSVVATGSATLAYQWFKDGTAISGATFPTFTVVSASNASVGGYTVRVSNGAGSATSQSASLTIGAGAVAPVITSQPASVSVAVGGNATFSVVATGTGTLSYQWRKGADIVAGATTPTLVLHAVTTAAAGVYSVTVTDLVGSVTSSSVTLTVN